MQELKNKIESVLFITGKFMSLQEIGDFSGIDSIGLVKDAINELVKEYSEKNSALEIIVQKDLFKLNIRKQYNYLTTQLASGCEMDAPTQATLALIAYKQPVLQAEIIKMRGNTAYDHIHNLKEIGLIVSEKHGRTRALKLAPKFYDYFDVVENVLREKLKETEEKVQDKQLRNKYSQENNGDNAPEYEAVIEDHQEKENVEVVMENCDYEGKDDEDWGKLVEET